MSPCAPGSRIYQPHICQFIVRDAEHLQSLKRLNIVEIDLIAYPPSPDVVGPFERGRRRAQIKTDLNTWKALLIRALKDSPSKERKLVRWKVSERNVVVFPFEYYFEDLESGELEVLPERALQESESQIPPVVPPN